MLDTTAMRPHARCVESTPQPAVVGVADHSGWAALVTVAAAEGRPVVVDRRRGELVGPDVPRQPYHVAEGLDADEAEDLVATVTAAARAGARSVLDTLLADVAPSHRVVALALRTAGGPAPPGTVARVLASHSAMHAAEGRLYRDALAHAAGERGLVVTTDDRGTAHARAAAALGTTPDRLASELTALGKVLGPPWRAEHRLATAAALCELAAHTDLVTGP